MGDREGWKLFEKTGGSRGYPCSTDVSLPYSGALYGFSRPCGIFRLTSIFQGKMVSYRWFFLLHFLFPFFIAIQTPCIINIKVLIRIKQKKTVLKWSRVKLTWLRGGKIFPRSVLFSLKFENFSNDRPEKDNITINHIPCQSTWNSLLHLINSSPKEEMQISLAKRG